MKKKKIIVSLIVLLAIAVYFVVFHKDKNLRYIPENADAVVLIDSKKLMGQYVCSWVMHPSIWFGSDSKSKSSGSLRDSGINIPDFLQVFHIKDSKFSEWYSVLELKDTQKFIAFLKKQKFTDKGNSHFQKDQIFLKIEGKHCIAGTSESGFETIRKLLLKPSVNPVRDADKFIQNTLGCISFISGQKIQNFSLELNYDEIEIKNNSNQEILNSLASKLQKEKHFLQVELDKENFRNFSRFFNKNISDSLEVNSLKAIADLEQVNDTIISYGYDDDFNEIEEKTFQNITQPNFMISIHSNDAVKTWKYFQSRKWINGENQFTAIPFQPNVISKNNNDVIIQSTKKNIVLSTPLKENYILVRNNVLLYSSLKTLSNKEKQIVSNIDYVLYRSKAKDYWVKIKAKKGDLPLILRW